ncbi:MAG TPA: hypothetical protein VII06_34405 [Chloroflexota bacterium]|jgi:hypothetical protein
MTSRQALLAVALLLLVALAHAIGRVTQLGGAQFAPSIAIYTLLALLLAPQLGWPALVGLALATGALTMLTTSTQPALPSFPAHAGGFLVAAALAKGASGRGADYRLGTMLGILAVTLVCSWTLFAATTWLLRAGTPFAEASRTRFGIGFGPGFLAWWLFGFVGVAIPSYVIGAILLPLLYRGVQPSLVRHGVLPAPERAVRA